MKSAVIFTGTGPILILTTYASLKDPQFIEKLAMKGIKKFIGCELDLEHVQKKYGDYYKSIVNDVMQSDDLRVLDYNGHSVFYNFSFKDLSKPVYHEP